jgi:hypothetical protein
MIVRLHTKAIRPQSVQERERVRRAPPRTRPSLEGGSSRETMTTSPGAAAKSRREDRRARGECVGFGETAHGACGASRRGGRAAPPGRCRARGAAGGGAGAFRRVRFGGGRHTSSSSECRRRPRRCPLCSEILGRRRGKPPKTSAGRRSANHLGGTLVSSWSSWIRPCRIRLGKVEWDPLQRASGARGRVRRREGTCTTFSRRRFGHPRRRRRHISPSRGALGRRARGAGDDSTPRHHGTRSARLRL